MNLCFMGLNMIFLPLTGLISLQDFLDYFITKEYTLLEDISSHMGQMAAFFASYLIATTFLFNCIQLLDIPHFLHIAYTYTIAYLRNRDWIDSYPF